MESIGVLAAAVVFLVVCRSSQLATSPLATIHAFTHGRCEAVVVPGPAFDRPTTR